MPVTPPPIIVAPSSGSTSAGVWIAVAIGAWVGVVVVLVVLRALLKPRKLAWLERCTRLQCFESCDTCDGQALAKRVDRLTSVIIILY